MVEKLSTVRSAECEVLYYKIQLLVVAPRFFESSQQSFSLQLLSYPLEIFHIYSVPYVYIPDLALNALRATNYRPTPRTET